ncbi:TetR/AcrR family transcriptional regulator [Streptomyces sp. NPDC088725]|uniref:TetR/AcrR family transcriptional regulator n=1 Tax=Streptomyces sp. NPDC088725 TaxID=3365873 RepID=UPI0038004C9F
MSRSANRTRNLRGEGLRLRGEILGAARELLEQTGSEEAITLRSVARQVGISAPSIYAHFADRDAIVDAIVADTFHDLAEVAQKAAASEQDPVDRLLALGHAYLRFAEEQPERYRVLFNRYRPLDAGGPAPATAADPVVEGLVGGRAFAPLIDVITACVESGESDSRSPFEDAVALWVTLHGYSSLRQRMRTFPWPDEEPFVRTFILRAARVTPRTRDAQDSRASAHPEETEETEETEQLS